MEAHTVQLVVRLEGSVVERYPLPTGTVALLGRLPASDLTLPHPLVSRVHAEVRRGGAGLILTDLDSSNGTFVGEERLLANQPHIIRAGETFRIGPFTIIFEAEPAEKVVASAEEDEVDIPPEAPADAEQSEQEAKAAIASALEAISGEWSLQRDGERALPERRSLSPALLPANGSSRYTAYLPLTFHEHGSTGNFIERFLLIFEAIWEPLEQRQDLIHMYFDPLTCPAPFLDWLASWLDFSLSSHWPEDLRRKLIREAVELYRWRGTRYGLSRMIEVSTGFVPIIEEAEPHIFRIRINEPVKDEQMRSFIEKLVARHKPAHAGYILELFS